MPIKRTILCLICPLLFSSNIAAQEFSEEHWAFEDGAVEIQCVDQRGIVVSGVTVRLAPDSYFGVPDSSKVLTSVTDRSGIVVFEGLDKATRIVHAESVGVGYWGRAPRPTPDRLYVRKQIVLSSYSLITGIVRDESARPLPGVEVWMRRNLLADITDAEGRFRIDHVLWESNLRLLFTHGEYGYYETGGIRPYGNYDIQLSPGVRHWIEVTTPSGEPVRDVEVTYELPIGVGFAVNQRTDFNGLVETVPLPMRQKLEVRALFREGPTDAVVARTATASNPIRIVAEIPEPPQTYSISGQVSDTMTGRPIPARINVDTQDGFMSGKMGETNSRGYFSVEGLLRGSYFVLALPEDRLTGQTDGPVRVRIDGQDISGLALEVGPAVAVQGRVVDERNEPIRGIYASVRGDGHHPQRYGKTDDEGYFTIGWMPAREKAFEVSASYEGVRDSATVPPLGPGEISEPVHLVLEGFRQRAKDRIIPFSGTVVSQTGHPVPYVTVSLQRDGHHHVSAMTHEDGYFEMAMKATGAFDVTVSDTLTLLPVFETSDLSLAVLAGGTINADRQGLVNHLIRVGEKPVHQVVTGIVSDEEGNPLGVSFTLMSEELYASGSSRDSGWFALTENRMPDEPFTVIFHHEEKHPSILVVDRDFTRGDRNVRVTLGSRTQGLGAGETVPAHDHVVKFVSLLEADLDARGTEVQR